VEAHTNRANALRALGQFELALASLDRAIALRPDDAPARANRSVALLAAGKFAEGWREYEWRWKGSGTQNIGDNRRRASRPLGLGRQSVAGQSILLHSEQGLGDTIQFCRYAPLVHELGARVILEVPGSLTSLLASLAGVSQLVPRGAALPNFDLQC